jgi:hypothetical protein
MIDRRWLQLWLIVLSTELALSLTCEPGEELKPHNLVCDVSQIADPYMWMKDNRVISSCFSTPSSVCDDYTSSYTAFLKGQSTTLTIINVTRQDQGTFTCNNDARPPNSSSCDFKVYARPQSVSCKAPELQPDMANVKVVCTVPRTYPSPTCQFSWLRNGIDTSLAGPQTITYQNLSAQGQPGYFYQTCTLTYPVQDLGLGSHAFRVKAYPSVYGNSSDTKYGIDSDLTSSVTISYPTVQLQSCLQGYVLEGSTVSCSCRETANTFLTANISFSQESTVQSSGPGLTTYNFTARRNTTEATDLICQATLLNWTSNNVTYKLPPVAYGPKNVTVKVNNLAAPGDISLCDKSQPVTLNVTCTVSVDGVSPGADYEFIINGSRRPANPVGSSSLTYSVTTGGLFSVQCNATNSGIKDLTAASQEQVIQVIEPPEASPIINKYSDSGSPVALTDGHLTVQEDINTRIRCRAEGGYPSVSSVSLGCGPLATTSVGNVAFLDVKGYRSRDASECSCTATHNSPCYRNNKAVLNLDVLFGPTLVSFTVNETAEIEIVVEKDSELRLACEAEGNPSPSLALTKDGLQLEVYNGLPQKFSLSLKLDKTKTDCRDAGVYSCRAQAGQGVANKSVYVNVRCPQQLENPFIQNKLYLAKTNSSVNISVAVLGYPEPTLQLNSDLVLDMKAYSLTYTKQRPSYGVVSLQIYTVTTSAFQNYSLIITNSLGTLVYRFQIQEGDPFPTSYPADPGVNVEAVVGSVVAGIAVIVAGVLFLVCLKRKGQRTREKRDIKFDSNTQTISPGNLNGKY